MTIEDFINKLASVPSSSKIYNPYTNNIKSSNLSIYLNYMAQNQPLHLLIGEAPGYLGCALSGIPFTDEYRLTNPDWKNCLPLQSSGYKVISQAPHREASSTIIWSVLKERNFYPLLWNVFPFHPHKENNRQSNRKPTQKEIECYSYFVEDLLSLFPSIENIYALGRTAEKALPNTIYIRHPANGGATQCKNQLNDIAV